MLGLYLGAGAGVASLNAVPVSSRLQPHTVVWAWELCIPWAFPSLNASRFLLGQVVHWAPWRAVPGELLSLAERGIRRRTVPWQQPGPGREGRHAPRGRRCVRHQVEPVRLPMKTGEGGPVPTEGVWAWPSDVEPPVCASVSPPVKWG